MNELNQRHIWLCADDYGISPAVSAAIRDLIELRRINATSVMVATPSFSRREASTLLAAVGSHAAIGLHVTLTAPFRPLDPHFVPLRGGAFPTLTLMASRALAHGLQASLLEDEITRQIDAFRSALGRLPDYFDGHQHIHVFPQIAEALLAAVKKTAPQAWIRQCGRSASARKGLSDPKALVLDRFSARLRRLAEGMGLRTNPAFAGTYAFRPRTDYAKLFAHFLDGLPDGGVVMCHPGKVDAELRRLDPLTDLREREYTFFRDKSFPRLLAERGVTLA